MRFAGDISTLSAFIVPKPLTPGKYACAALAAASSFVSVCADLISLVHQKNLVLMVRDNEFMWLTEKTAKSLFLINSAIVSYLSLIDLPGPRSKIVFPESSFDNFS